MGTDRQSQETTDFLERYGTRLEGIKPKGEKAQRTSEKVSRGGFTRRKGWYLLSEECKEWWSDTEMDLLWAYWFDGHVTASDGSVGTVSMGAGFVCLDRLKCGSELIGREEEVTSSGRAQMGTYASILRRTPDQSMQTF